MQTDPNVLKLIQELSDAPGASGFEDEVLAVVRAALDDICTFEEDKVRNLYIYRQNHSGEKPVLMLDAHGICASSGSACTSGSLDPSHVLLAIGRVHDVAHGSLRLSLCEYNTEEEIDHILTVVPEVVQYLRNMSPVWRDLQTGKREYIL